MFPLSSCNIFESHDPSSASSTEHVAAGGFFSFVLGTRFPLNSAMIGERVMIQKIGGVEN